MKCQCLPSPLPSPPPQLLGGPLAASQPIENLSILGSKRPLSEEAVWTPKNKVLQ
jgi:hypothetical protein